MKPYSKPELYVQLLRNGGGVDIITTSQPDNDGFDKQWDFDFENWRDL